MIIESACRIVCFTLGSVRTPYQLCRVSLSSLLSFGGSWSLSRIVVGRATECEDALKKQKLASNTLLVSVTFHFCLPVMMLFCNDAYLLAYLDFLIKICIPLGRINISYSYFFSSFCIQCFCIIC